MKTKNRKIAKPTVRFPTQSQLLKLPVATPLRVNASIANRALQRGSRIYVAKPLNGNFRYSHLLFGPPVQCDKPTALKLSVIEEGN